MVIFQVRGSESHDNEGQGTIAEGKSFAWDHQGREIKKRLNLRGYLEVGFQDKGHQAVKDKFSNLKVHRS